MREHPLAAEPRRVRLPGVDEAHGVVDAAELEQRLGVVGASTSGCSARATPSSLACASAFASHSLGRRRVSAPERDEPENRQVERRMEPELLLGEYEGALRVLAGDLELAAVDGDEASGRWFCGTSRPYWARMSCARAA